ncbi:MAG TPA: hypothetical protein VGB52_12575 [Actinomycetota bacterium]
MIEQQPRRRKLRERVPDETLRGLMWLGGAIVFFGVMLIAVALFRALS